MDYKISIVENAKEIRDVEFWVERCVAILNKLTRVAQ